MISFLVRSGLTGFAGGCVFVALMLGFDVLGMASMMQATRDGHLVVLIMLAAFPLTFAALAMGASVMSLPWDWDEIERQDDQHQKGDRDDTL